MNKMEGKTGRDLMREAVESGEDVLNEFFLMVAVVTIIDGETITSAADYLLDCYQRIRWIKPDNFSLDQPDLLEFLNAPTTAQRAKLAELYRDQHFPHYLIRVGLLCFAVSDYSKKFGKEIFNG